MIISPAAVSGTEPRSCVIGPTNLLANARWTRSSIAKENRWRCCNSSVAASLCADEKFLLGVQLEIDLHFVKRAFGQSLWQRIDLRHTLRDGRDRFIDDYVPRRFHDGELRDTPVLLDPDLHDRRHLRPGGDDALRLFPRLVKTIVQHRSIPREFRRLLRLIARSFARAARFV